MNPPCVLLSAVCVGFAVALSNCERAGERRPIKAGEEEPRSNAPGVDTSPAAGEAGPSAPAPAVEVDEEEP
jgi:hypothetical protein